MQQLFAEQSFLQLLLLFAITVGVNHFVWTSWRCRYCGKGHTTGIVIALLNDLFGISLCKHEQDF